MSSNTLSFFPTHFPKSLSSPPSPPQPQTTTTTTTNSSTKAPINFPHFLVLLPSPALHHQNKDSSFESKGPSSTDRPSNYYSTNGCSSIRSVKNKNQKQSWPKNTNPITRFSSPPSPTSLTHSPNPLPLPHSSTHRPTHLPTHSLIQLNSTQLNPLTSLPSHPLSSQNTSTILRISKLTRPLR